MKGESITSIKGIKMRKIVLIAGLLLATLNVAANIAVYQGVPPLPSLEDNHQNKSNGYISPPQRSPSTTYYSDGRSSTTFYSADGQATTFNSDGSTSTTFGMH